VDVAAQIKQALGIWSGSHALDIHIIKVRPLSTSLRLQARRTRRQGHQLAPHSDRNS
jgi:hypothetical protein